MDHDNAQVTTDTEPDIPDEAPAARTWGPDPAALKRTDNPTGPEITISGRGWRLRPGGLSPSLDTFRDRVYDQVTIRGTVDMDDVRSVAYLALTANYKLADDQVIALLWQADVEELVEAVREVLFEPSKLRRTYTSWARSALIMNGIRPDSVAPADLPHVLLQLVHTKKCMPVEEYTEAGEFMSLRAGLLEQVKEKE